MASVAATGRADLTDAQWAILEPLLPVGHKPGRPPKWTKRQLINGIRWRVRVGSPWRDVPPVYGCWQTVYGLFRRWQRAGVWALITAALQARADAAGLITWDVSVDSTINRAHQHAAGARTDGELQKEPPGGTGDPEPADHGLGRSRGGWTTKLHLAVEQGQKPLALVMTGGQRGDSPQFQVVLERIRVARLCGGRSRSRPDRVLADRAYGSRANRAYLRCRGIRCTIPEKTDQVRHRKTQGPRRRPATNLRSRHLQAAPRRGMRHQPPQTQPRGRHPIRQAGSPLRSHHHHRSDQRVATPLKHDLGPGSTCLRP